MSSKSSQSGLWRLLLLWAFQWRTVLCYTLHTNCFKFQRGQILSEQIQLSVREAIRMAEYAKWRVENETPQNPIGNVVEQLLGDDNPRQKFTDAMGRVASTFGSFTDPFDWAHVDKDPTVIIRCGTSFVKVQEYPQLEGKPTMISDTDFNPLDNPNLPKSPNARYAGFYEKVPCHPAGRSIPSAYTIATGLSRTGDPRGPSHAITLCEGYPDSALSKPLIWGLRWKTTNWAGEKLPTLESYISSVLLHEVMHAMDIGLLDKLPSGRKEAYGYEVIKDLSTADKQANADSYAVLAQALWMKRNPITDIGTFGARFSMADVLTLSEPNDPHPELFDTD